ncbi:MAG: hypothetical protein LIP02_00880 [Bacteroidales bacterium]|nr:hypothetical protein [Bacteroidales bacterium]
MNAALRIAIGIVAFSAWVAQADTPGFASDRLERLASRVGVEDGATVELEGVGSVPLRVDTDSVTGVVTHIGLRVFSDRQRRMAPSPVYDFLERYTLEALLPGERPKPLEKQLVEDDLEFCDLDLQGIAQMSLDTADATCTVTCLAGRRYRVEWPYAKGRSRAVDFPVNHRLLLGQDMDELERRLISRLETSAQLGRAGSWTALANDPPTIANVTILCYGGNKSITLPLGAILAVLKAEGCDFTESTIPSDNDSISKQLILANNPSLGYCHSLRVETHTRCDTVTARLVPYLPMSKVENLFYENKLAE